MHTKHFVVKALKSHHQKTPTQSIWPSLLPYCVWPWDVKQLLQIASVLFSKSVGGETERGGPRAAHVTVHWVPWLEWFCWAPLRLNVVGRLIVVDFTPPHGLSAARKRSAEMKQLRGVGRVADSLIFVSYKLLAKYFTEWRRGDIPSVRTCLHSSFRLHIQLTWRETTLWKRRIKMWFLRSWSSCLKFNNTSMMQFQCSSELGRSNEHLFFQYCWNRK